MNTLVLTRKDLTEIVKTLGRDALMDEVLLELARVLKEHDDARTQIPKRQGFTYEKPRPGVLEWMPVMSASRQVVVKVVSYNPGNPTDAGLPTIVSTISMYDCSTGHLVALMDGILLTALRTGAASATATRILARSGSSTVGLIGCGAQAVTQIHALSRVMRIQRVLFFDTDPAALASFPRRTGFLGLKMDSAPPDVVAREADVLCTATSVEVGKGPVFEDRDLKPWIHVNAVGSDLPGKIELPLSLLKRSLVCPDFVEQALVEGESQQLDVSALGPSLPELVKNQALFEEHRDRPTVFDSTGYALEDMVAAEIVLAHARNMGLGREIAVEGILADPRNPYAPLDVQVYRTAQRLS